MHIYNISALLSSFLPYHESALFARLLQVLHIHLSVGAALPANEPNSNKLFGFLEAAQKEGSSSITRHTLVQRCMHDHAFLQWLVSLVAVKGAAQLSNTTITFYTTLMLELLTTLRGANNANHSEAKDAIARAIVQHALEVLNAHVNATAPAASADAAKPTPAVAGPPRELVFSSLLLLSQAALVHPFGSSLEAALFLLLKSMPSARGEQTLAHPVAMALLALAQNQHVNSAPPAAVSALIASQGAEAGSPFVSTLANLSQQYDIAHLVQVLLPQLAVAHVGSERKHAHLLLSEMVSSLPLTDSQVHTLVSTLLQSYVAAHDAVEWSAKEISSLRKLVLLIQGRYSTLLESVVQQVIEQAKTTADNGAAATDDAEMADAAHSKKSKNQLKSSPLLSLIHLLFEGSAHEVLIGVQGQAAGAPQSASILTCLNSPLAHVRIQALQAVEQLDAAAIAADNNEGESSLSTHLHSALLSKLADAEPSVVRATLKLKSLVRLVPFGELVAALAGIFSRSAAVIDLQSLTRSSNHKVLESALKLAGKMAAAVWSDESVSLEQQATQLHSLLHTLFPFLFELAFVRPSAGVTSKIARAAQSLMVLLASKAKHAALHPAAAGEEDDEQQNGFLLCALFAHMEAVPEAAEDDQAQDASIRTHNQSILAAWSNNLVKLAAGASSPLQLQQLAAIEDEIIGSLERVAASVGVASRSSNKIAGGRVDAPTTAFALLQLLNQTLQQLATSKKTGADLFLRFARAQQKALATVWGALTTEQRRAAYASSSSSASSSNALVAPSSFVSSASGSSLVPSAFPAFVRSSLALSVSVSSEFVSTHRSDEDRARAQTFVRELYGFFVSDSSSVEAFGAHIALLCKQHLQGGNMQETVRFLLPLLHASGSGVAASLQVSVRSFHLLHALLQNHASGKSKPNKEDATLLAELGATFLLAFASPARAVRHAALMAIPALCAALTPAASADKKGAGALVAALLTAMGTEKEELLAASSTDPADDDESLLESATDASLQHVQAFMLKTLGSDATHGAFKSEAHRVELHKFLTVLALRLAGTPESIASGWRLLQILRRLSHEPTAELLLDHLRAMLSKPIRTLAQMSVAVELLHQLDAAVVQKDTAASFACLTQSLSLSVDANAEAMRDENDDEDDEDAASSRQVVASIQQAALSRISTEVFELLSEEQQEQLFETLLRIHSAGQTAAAALVAQLPFDSGVFAKRLVLASGKHKKSKSGGSSAAEVTAVLELLQLKGEPQHSLRSPFALVAPLFHLLEQLCAQESGAESAQLQSYEYSKQLSMAALTRFLAIPAEEAAAAAGGSKKSKKAAASAGINVKDINVDAVVACLSANAVAEAPSAVAASSPAAEAHQALHTLNGSLENTRSHALTLLSLIGKSHPELVVDKLVPIFQTLLVHSTDSNTKTAANAVSSAMEVEEQAAESTEAAAADSEPYALRLLNQLISTVLPSVVQAKLHWNVWQLLGVFVESLTVRSPSSVSSTAKSLLKKKAVASDSAHSSVVNRRRLHLFHNLLTSLQTPKEAGSASGDDDDNYLHIVVALLLAKSVIRSNTSNASVSSKQESAAYKASLQEFAHALCEQFGEEPVFQIRAFNSLLQLLGAEIESEHGELLASQQKHVGAPLRLGAASRSKKAAASASSEPSLSPLASLLRTPAQISSWQKGVLSFLSQHLARLTFAQQIYLHAKRTQQTADDKDEIQTSFLHLFEHLFARLRSSLQLSKHLATDSASAALSNHFLLLSTHTKQALLHLNGLLTMPNFVRILQELFRISSGSSAAGGRRDVPLILQALSLLNSKLISYRDRAKLQSFGATKKAEEEADEADADMSDPNSVERVAFFKNKKAEQRLLVSLLPALQQLLEVESGAESDAASSSSSSSHSDVAAMKQSALLNLEMLTSSFGHMRQFQPEFVKLVSAVLKLITLPNPTEGKDHGAEVQALLQSHSWQHISTSALLCLATLVSSFHAKSHVLLLEFIPTMVPNTLAILQHINAPAPAVHAPKSAAKASKLAGKKRKHGEEDEEESDEEADEPASLQTLDSLPSPLLQLSALSLLQACIQTVADLLSPYLADLLKVFLFPGYHNQAGVSSALHSVLALSPMAPASAASATSSSSTAPASSAVGSSSSVDHSSVSTVVTQSLTSLIELVPSRTLLPIIFSHYKIAAPQGYSSLRRLFQVLGLVVQQLKSDAVKQHFKLIFKFFLAAAQQLRKSLSVSGSDADAYGVTLSQAEDALIGSFLELIMKLNETSFKGLFLKMLQWVGPIPTAGSELLSGVDGASSTAEFLNRSLVFFKLIHQVTLKLKGMFVSYFGYIMDHCVVFLNAPKKGAAAAANASMEDEEASEARSEDEDEEGNESGSNKKHKQSDGSAAASSKAASNAAALSGGIAGGVPSELIDLVLLSLRNCFLYDTQHFMDKVSGNTRHDCSDVCCGCSLACISLSSVCFLLCVQYHFQLLTGPMVQQLQYAFTTRVGKASAGVHAHAAYDDFVTHTLTPTLVQLAIRMGNYLQWKPLVSALLLHGRSPSAAVRRASVYVFEQLFVSIGDNLLVIMPEMMPWIAEMSEDGDVGVERNVQKLVKIIEKMSGESLDATLQGAD